MTITAVIGPNKIAHRFTGKAQLKKPNLWRVEAAGRIDFTGMGARHYLLISDGKTSWKTNLLTHRFLRDPAVVLGSDKKEYTLFPADPLSRLFFYDAFLSLQEYSGVSSGARDNRKVNLLPAQKIDGIECGVVEIQTSGIDTGRTIQFYVSADYLVRRIIVKDFGGGMDTIEVNLKNIQTDKDIPRRTFAFAPSPQAVKSKQPVERGYWFQGFMVDE